MYAGVIAAKETSHLQPFNVERELRGTHYSEFAPFLMQV